jgi:hypothetical protein
VNYRLTVATTTLQKLTALDRRPLAALPKAP